MPELPEVETIRKTLHELVAGETIEAVIVSYPKLVHYEAGVEQFCQALQGETIEQVGRRGKFILFELSSLTLLSHLRMEGKFGVYEASEPYDKHTHVRFVLASGKELRYRDVRKFGTMHLYAKGTALDNEPLKKLGPEPFAPEFTHDYLARRLARTSRSLKQTLLDQTIVVGLGNIYVDEALHRAKLSPFMPAKEIAAANIPALHEAIVHVLTSAVEAGGSTIRTYVNTQGQIGMFQVMLQAYGQQGKPCSHCGTELVKTQHGGRGTHYCPTCQKVKI